jgi:hypothetical protein
MAGKQEFPERHDSRTTVPPEFTDVDDDGQPMTDEQATRLKALAWQLGIPYQGNLSRAQAAWRIKTLRQRS